MKMEEYLKNIEDNNVSYWLYVRENLKPNDYVKLNTGEITRSMNVSPIKGNKVYYANGDDCWFDISAVRNFSPNIIDLIEVGDYVNGLLIKSIGDNFYNCGHTLVYFKNIKSIVTKEQFESIEYKVGE